MGLSPYPLPPPPHYHYAIDKKAILPWINAFKGLIYFKIRECFLLVHRGRAQINFKVTQSIANYAGRQTKIVI